MAEYDEQVIRKFANRLYAKAARVVFVYAFFGIVAGLALGWILGITEPVAMMLWGTGYEPQKLAMLAGGGILGLAGLALGLRRSFFLKLQAQLALCQMQIERNTRPATPPENVEG